jgi:hypothetical protein
MDGDVSRTMMVRVVFPVSHSISGWAMDMATRRPMVTAISIDRIRRSRSNREFSRCLARTLFHRRADEMTSLRRRCFRKYRATMAAVVNSARVAL